MKFKSTWVLALVAVAFGSYIYFVEIKKAAKDEEKKAESEKVLSVDTDKAKAIEIKNTNGDFQIEKDAQNKWELKNPVSDRADDTVVTGMLSAIKAEKYDDVASEGDVDLKTYGLDNPKSMLVVTTAAGATQKVLFGNDASLPGKVYVLRDGEKKVLLAYSSLKTQVEKTLKDLRDKRIFRGNKDDVAAIEVRYAAKDNHSQVALQKKDKDWLLAKPRPGRADNETVQNFLTAIDGLRATDFVSEKGGDKAELKKYGLTQPEIEVSLLDKENKPVAKISISPKKDNNAYVVVDGRSVIYQVFASASDSLRHQPDDFKDKKTPFEFNKDDSNEILLKTSFVDLDLVKKGNTWEMAKPDPKKEVSQIQVTSLLDKLSQVKVGEFLNHESPKGLNPPKGRLTIKDAKGQVVFGMTWGEKTKSGKNYYVLSEKDKNVYGVDSSTIDGLPSQTLVETKTPAPPGVNQAANEKAKGAGVPGTSGPAQNATTSSQAPQGK